ncbi:MAG TPA: hypothetical protein VG944_05585 [Fimbriimonas sp.]|nr:hypothetical protein [Fimbriimonas sp.]
MRPVADQATRNSIIKAFQTQLEAAAKQASLEADENAKTLAKEKQAHDDAMRAAAEQERKNHAIAADEAAAEEIHRFVYPSAGESKHHLSIVVLSADGSADQSISPKYAEMLRSSGLKCDGPIFTPEFTSSQGFQRLISNSREGVQTFRPENYVSYLLVVKESSPAQSHQTIAGTDMIVSDTNWTVDLIAVEDARTVRSWTISERGTGFSDAESAKLAITRAEQHLARLAPDIQAASM